eukprot:TRINITY_DN12203_c2_g2_i2.p1 TRINITY_DN12203_c2_g2~~TRINITY_DN12203_c2_g2_i2.p1  ORF type:complete len:187 (-),score=7.52 TRINITY_DN12203_c2_g2_i2:5-565(-)
MTKRRSIYASRMTCVVTSSKRLRVYGPIAVLPGFGLIASGCRRSGNGKKRERQQGSVINKLPDKLLTRPFRLSRGKATSINEEITRLSVRCDCFACSGFERPAFVETAIVEHVIKCWTYCPAVQSGSCIANCIQTYRCSSCTQDVSEALGVARLEEEKQATIYDLRLYRQNNDSMDANNWKPPKRP